MPNDRLNLLNHVQKNCIMAKNIRCTTGNSILLNHEETTKETQDQISPMYGSKLLSGIFLQLRYLPLRFFFSQSSYLSVHVNAKKASN